MVAISTTTKSLTYLKGTKLGTNASTTSLTYVQADSSLSFTSVPALSKIYYNFYVQKITAGTMDIRIRDITNGVTLFEQTGITTTAAQYTDISGTLLSHTLAGTVEVQILSSDGNTANLIGSSLGVSWICISDATTDFVFTGGVQSYTISGKRSMGTLRGFVGPEDTTAATVFNTTVSGLYLSGDPGGANTQENNSFDLDVMTNEIKIDLEGTPTWTDTYGQAIVIFAYDGLNLEVTA